jgi:hypothetical protein
MHTVGYVIGGNVGCETTLVAENALQAAACGLQQSVVQQTQIAAIETW